MKVVATVSIAALCVVLIVQNGSNAGPGPTPRTVPVIIHGVMQPSRMVAVTLSDLLTGTTTAAPISLDAGQVFILTAATLSENFNTPGGRHNVTILRGAKPVDRLTILETTSGTTDTQHLFPTGIRFARAASGLADLFIRVESLGVHTDVALHGYITDDF